MRLILMSWFFCGGLFSGSLLQAQAPVNFNVSLAKDRFTAADTIKFTARLDDSVYTRKAITLNVWIEDVHRSCRWRLRYPMLNGNSQGTIILPQGISDDYYAFHFSVQPGFFDLSGLFPSKYEQDSVGYTFVVDRVTDFTGLAAVHHQAQFRLGRLLFQGSGYFTFYNPAKPTPFLNNIGLVTPLDSFYTAVADTTLLMPVGNASKGVVAEEYKFSMNEFKSSGGTLVNETEMLPRNAKAEKLEKEYVRSPVFASRNSYLFSGEAFNYLSDGILLVTLDRLIPGIAIAANNEGIPVITWNGSPTALYLDEIPADIATLAKVPVKELILIKAFRPPFFTPLGGGPGGAIAFYSRKGSATYRSTEGRYWVTGYTPPLFQLPSRY